MTLSSLYYTCTICRNGIINKIIYHFYKTPTLKAQRNVLMLLEYFAREIKLRQIASLKKKKKKYSISGKHSIRTCFRF